MSIQAYTDRIVAALERQVLRPGDAVESSRPHLDGLLVLTRYAWYQAAPAPWRLADNAWTAAAVRVVETMPVDCSPAFIHGLVLTRAGESLYLNEVATMRRLGRGLGAEVDPIAYADVLAELYSGRDISGPVVTASAPGPAGRAGWFVGDVAAVAAEFPYVDRRYLTPPVVRRAEVTTVEFVSCHEDTRTFPLAVDVLGWSVSGGGAQEASWTRSYVAEGLEAP